LVTGACFEPVAGGDVFVGAGSSGTAVAEVGGGATFAGWVPKPFSSTERGADVWVDMICRMKQRPRKIPPPHQLAVVRRFPACLIPIKASGDELAPPKLAASPVPFPLWSRIARIRTTQSSTSIVRRNV
jgi:hypothetical protein